MARRVKRCPRCGSTNVAKLVFGLITPEGAESYRGKNVVFGGCCVPRSEPRSECRECGKRFGGRSSALSEVAQKLI
jgi:hypothetical protein